MTRLNIEMIKRIQKGDQKAKGEFFIRKMSLVEKICDKVDCEALGIEKEDLLAEARLSLFEAINRFNEIDSTEVARYSQFAYGIIRSDIRKFVKRNRRDNKIWLDEKVYKEKTDEWMSNLDLLVQADENVEEEATDLIFEEEIKNSKLTKKCAMAVDMVLSKDSRGLAQCEIAKKLGTSQPVFAQNLKRGIGSIKEDLFSQKELEEFGI